MKKQNNLTSVVNIKNTSAETALTLHWPNVDQSLKT